MHPAYMKYFFAFVFVLAAGTLWAQTNSDQLYGFRQTVIPGAAAAKRITDDAGNVIENNTENNRYNYYIYLATSAKTRVYPVEIWLKGEPFSARPETVASTPVTATDNVILGRAQKTILVPKTTQKVIRLIPTPLMADKSSNKAKSLAQEAELVVVYKQGGKTYYKTLKTLTTLAPKALQ